MSIIESALNSPQCVISVMGDHAGEDTNTIFDRKKADIRRKGITFWLIRSPKAKPPHVQQVCNSFPSYTIFIEPATKGGARPTTKKDAAKEYSNDGKVWHQLPKGLGPVTGKLDKAANSLVFDKIETDIDETLDLWNYAEAFDVHKPIKFILGCSTICAIRKDMKVIPDRMKSRYRKIVAVGRFVEPYSVWLR
ncbi:MAG TPA: hypothetical protein DDX93_03650 [Smithella sp.]|jgi:hypothetical protein|nr:hypothetical protein [Smithella sp.]